MKSALPVTPILFALLWSAIPAAEGPKVAPPPAKEKPSPEAAALKPESVIPKRELVFDQSEDEVGLAFPSPERPGMRPAEVAQQRYVAFLTLRFGVPTIRDDPLMSMSDQGGIQMITLRNLLARAQDPALLSYLLGQMPRERLPSGDVLKMLTADRQVHLLDGIQRTSVKRDGAEVADSRMPASRSAGIPSRSVEWMAYRIILAAPTADRAKQLAEAVLSAYDYGFSRPYHQILVERLAHNESVLAEQRGEAKKLEDEMAACQKELDDLKPWSDITTDSLTSLTTQRRLIAVEEAGLKARIAACEKLLKEDRSSFPQRREQVVTAKTIAEIELVGLAGKRVAIEEIIEKGRKRLDLQARIISLNQQQSRFAIRRIESSVAAYKQCIGEKLPFAQVEGKVVIRRIRWEQAPPPAPPPAKATAK